MSQSIVHVKLSELDQRIDIKESVVSLNEFNEVVKNTQNYKGIWARIRNIARKVNVPKYFSANSLLSTKSVYEIVVKASEILPDVRNVELVEWKNKNLYVVSSFEKRNRFVFFYAVEIVSYDKNLNDKNGEDNKYGEDSRGSENADTKKDLNSKLNDDNRDEKSGSKKVIGDQNGDESSEENRQEVEILENKDDENIFD